MCVIEHWSWKIRLRSIQYRRTASMNLIRIRCGLWAVGTGKQRWWKRERSGAAQVTATATIWLCDGPFYPSRWALRLAAFPSLHPCSTADFTNNQQYRTPIWFDSFQVSWNIIVIRIMITIHVISFVLLFFSSTSTYSLGLSSFNLAQICVLILYYTHVLLFPLFLCLCTI